MSATSAHETPDDGPTRTPDDGPAGLPDHTTLTVAEWKALARSHRPPEGPREKRCPEPGCRSRLTIGTDGTEFGHVIDCPERPDYLPRGGGSGGSYYSEDGGEGGGSA